MEPLPVALEELLPPENLIIVREWWTGLSEFDRQKLRESWNEVELAFFTLEVGDTPPIVFRGRFAPSENDPWYLEDWEDDWREYLVEHPMSRFGNPQCPGVLLASQFQANCFLSGFGGQICIHVDWDRTNFDRSQRPPSERYFR